MEGGGATEIVGVGLSENGQQRNRENWEEKEAWIACF